MSSWLQRRCHSVNWWSVKWLGTHWEEVRDWFWGKKSSHLLQHFHLTIFNQRVINKNWRGPCLCVPVWVFMSGLNRSVCVRVQECLRVCVREREREWVCMWVCEWDRERKRKVPIQNQTPEAIEWQWKYRTWWGVSVTKVICPNLFKLSFEWRSRSSYLAQANNQTSEAYYVILSDTIYR